MVRDRDWPTERYDWKEKKEFDDEKDRERLIESTDNLKYRLGEREKMVGRLRRTAGAKDRRLEYRDNDAFV